MDSNRERTISDRIISGLLVAVFTTFTAWAGWSTNEVFRHQEMLKNLTLTDQALSKDLDLINYKLDLLLKKAGLDAPTAAK